MRYILAAILALGSIQASAQSTASCIGKAIWYEARGESLRVKKAVVQVIKNRARIDKISICSVIKKRGAFPWISRVKSWRLSTEQVAMLFDVIQHRPVVNSRVYYFNHVRLTFGVKQRKLGRMYFSEREG